MLVLDVSSLWRMSVTYDEPAHIEFGRSLLERGSDRHSTQKMAISLVSYLPVYALQALGIGVSPRTSLVLSRLPSVVAALVLVTLVFRWARRLYGLRGALLSATLATLCPTLIAHAGLATNDIYCACLMLAATMLFVRYLATPTPSRLILCAAVTGLAQITKHTALLLFPIFAVLWILDALHAGGRIGYRRLLGHGALGAVVVLVMLNAGYLFRGSLRPVQAYVAEYTAKRPEFRSQRALTSMASLASHVPGVLVPLPRGYVYALATGVHYNATGGGRGPVYLLGRLDQKGWWYYFAVAVVLKTPLAVLLILVAAAALSPSWFRKHPLDEAALLTAVVAIFAFFSFACTAQIGIRYVLPAFPFLFVAAGKVAAHVPARYPVAFRAVLALLVLWAAISSLSFHPHHLSYFNELIGDRKNMYRYLADSNVDWGQSNGDLKRYLEAQGRGRVVVNPASPVTGRVAVNVNALLGVTVPAEKYAWLRGRFEPVEHVGYAWLVFDVPSR